MFGLPALIYITLLNIAYSYMIAHGCGVAPALCVLGRPSTLTRHLNYSSHVDSCSQECLPLSSSTSGRTQAWGSVVGRGRGEEEMGRAHFSGVEWAQPTDVKKVYGGVGSRPTLHALGRNRRERRLPSRLNLTNSFLGGAAIPLP